MPSRLFISLLSAILPLMAPAQRDTISLNRGWQFCRIAEQKAMPQRLDTVTYEETVNLPHDFQISQPWIAPAAGEKADDSNVAANIKSRLSARGFKELTKGIYRRTLDVADNWRGKRLTLDFGGIMLVGDVWFNGHHVGRTDYGYLGFESDITKHVRYGGENEIIVTAETMGPGNSRWYTGGGLYRDVNLIVTPSDNHFNRHPLHISAAPLTPLDGTLDPATATIGATVAITADFRYVGKEDSVMTAVTILDPQGRVVTESRQKSRYYRQWRSHEYALPPITIAGARLWDISSPYLYTAVVTLYNADGSVADRVSERFGIRTIAFSPERGFVLNGRKVLLKGNANHHTLGALGAAAFPRAIEQRLRLLKSFGFNCIRCSHNPYSTDFYRLCDELGVLVVDELYDKWTQQYAGGRTDWTLQWQHDVAEWVCRDRNHPSVIMWSLGNELQQIPDMAYNDWGVTAYRLMQTLLHRYDTTRPTTVAMHPRYRSLEGTDYPAPLAVETEVNSYNYRYMYFPGDSKLFPEKVFFQSEASIAAMGPNFYAMDLDRVIGLAYWGTIDYIGESGGWPAKGWAQGTFDISLQPKPIAWMQKSMFDTKPTVHIGIIERDEGAKMWNGVNVGTQYMSESWNRTAGDTLSLVVFTNAEEVEINVNGHTVARKPNTTAPETRNRIAFNGIRYEAGYVEAVAYNSGKAVARHRIETTGKAVRITATPEQTGWKADGQDLMHIRLTAVDSKGRRVADASNLVRLSLRGGAEIAGLSNGDIATADNYAAGEVHLFQGTALVVIRAGETEGRVTLTAEAEGIGKRDITLTMTR